MTVSSIETHRQFLAEIDKDIERKETELEELQAVRRWHELKLSENNGSTQIPISKTSGFPRGYFGGLGLTGHEAAREVLDKNGTMMSIRDIAAVLRKYGYSGNDDDTKFHASLTTAMKRKDDMFVNPERGKWGLREWLGASTEDETNENSPEE